MARVTLRQIAERAGVSLATVSLALSRPEAPVARSTRRKVLQIARDMGYQTASIAGAVRRPLRHLGLVLGERQDDWPFMSATQNGIHLEALQRGYLPVIHRVPVASAMDYAPVVTQIAELYHSKLVDGFILNKRCFASWAVRKIHELGVITVLINGHDIPLEDGRMVPIVLVDNREAGRLATSHLIELGHRRIALISPPCMSVAMVWRPWQIWQIVLGYEQALASAGLRVDFDLVGEADRLQKAQVYAAVERILKLPEPPTALFVASDRMALMVLNAVRLGGRSVPRDLSVVGYGNIPASHLLAEPELTTVHGPFDEVGRIAADMLIRLLEGHEPEQDKVVLQPHMVVRGTTAPPKA